MSNKFTDHVTVIDADWCNTVDQTVFTALASADTPSAVRTAISAIVEAPNDSTPYVRRNEGWESLADHVLEEAPIDAAPYVRVDSGWESLSDHSELIVTSRKRGWLLSDFAGEDNDTRLSNALADLEAGSTLIIPPTDDGSALVFDGNHILDLSESGHYINIRAENVLIRCTASDYWLTLQGTADTNPYQPQTIISGLILEPVAVKHWGGSGGIRLQHTVNILLDRIILRRFGLAGINIHNIDGWTEQTTIQNCWLAGNRVGLLCDREGDGTSQRGTKLLNTFFAAFYNPGGDDYPSEASVGEDSEWHTHILVRDVSVYHGTWLGVGGGLKRDKTKFIWMDGGRGMGIHIFAEAESDRTNTNVIGLHLTNYVDEVPHMLGASGTITLTAFPDGGDDESEGYSPSSAPILDERTGVTRYHGLGDLRFRGGKFFDVGSAYYNGNFGIVPATGVMSDSADQKLVFSGLIQPDGTIVREESWTHDSTDGYRDYTHEYLPAEVKMSTSAYGGSVPLALECITYNENPHYVTSFLDDDGTKYIDISETHSAVIRLFLDSAATLHQVRGGRPGQKLTIYSLNSYPVIAHDAVAEDGNFQLINGVNWYSSGTYACRQFQYVYHATKGWFWLDLGGSPNNTGESTQVRENSFSSSQLKALRATPRTLVLSPGTGYAAILTGVQFWHDAGTGYTVAGDNDIEVRYTDGSGHLFCTLECTGFLDQATDQHRYIPVNTNAITPVEDAAIVCKMAGAAEIADGTGILKFRAFYKNVTLGW